MNKKSIVEWLKVKQSIALAEVGKQYAESVAQARAHIWEEVELSKYAARMQRKIDDFQDIAVELEGRVGGLDGVALNMYHRPSQKIYDLVKSQKAVEEYCKSILIHESASPLFQRFSKSRRELEDGIKASYTTAIENVKACKDAKAAVEYLCGLGFDREELELLDSPKTVTALMRPIDTRYLFVNAGAKELHEGAE